ncbi:MAG TPA: type VII secretion-associated serine protease mycosin [Jatrophihabitantaceae bacterium]|nr:type VII secretion-associated serine protease mycosin [Jatrophihabitantaceae bacterium]
MRRKALALSAMALFASLVAAPAQAAPSPSPPFKYSKTTDCVTSANTRSTLKSGVSWAQTQLDYTALWKLGDKGAGETVAVIDTGVNPVLAFSGRLLSGGDYVVADGDGRSDCDGHGTVVAGIIAAHPDQTTGFSGVAPDAKILPIRQSSNYYGVKNARAGSPQETAGNTTTLGDAIRYAVDQGAKVINISEASCRNASKSPDQTVQSDIDYAVRNDVVVVAAAGNVDESTQCKQQNTPGADPVTFPTPAAMKGVLAVGAVDPNGDPAPFSLAGPWVDVAAPGVGIISTNPAEPTGQINEFITSSGVTTIQGTSFAAPYVAGLAALIQERFPNLGALGVIRRIEQTAEHPSAPGERNDYVGYGMIDPAAALTAVLPSEASATPAPRPQPSVLPAAHSHPDIDQTTRLIALISTVGLLVLAASASIALSTRRRRAEALVRQARLRSGAGARRRG